MKKWRGKEEYGRSGRREEGWILQGPGLKTEVQSKWAGTRNGSGLEGFED